MTITERKNKSLPAESSPDSTFSTPRTGRINEKKKKHSIRMAGKIFSLKNVRNVQEGTTGEGKKRSERKIKLDNYG